MGSESGGGGEESAGGGGRGSSGSYRSPTKWQNFGEEEEEDSGGGEEDESVGPASPGSEAGKRGWGRLDSQGGSSVGLAEGRDPSPSRASSEDTETKQLLLGEEGASEAEDAASLAESCEGDPYALSDEQRAYYTKHFKTLLLATGRPLDLAEGAVRGSDEKVKEFFHKSSLSQDSLCKIWQLADVNQDGWLNMEEFNVAMHLIVLHVKGNLLIPDFLPPHIAPRVTPPRADDAPPGWTNFGARRASKDSAGLDGNGVSPSPHSREFTSQPPTAGAEKPIPQRRRPSASPETLATPRGNDFADGPINSAPTPPRRRVAAHQTPVPAATKAKTASLPLSPPSHAQSAPKLQSAPKGPPPKPPPRPPHRSHGRSASLDLSKGGLGPASGNGQADEGAGGPPSEPVPPAPLRDTATQTVVSGWEEEGTDVGLSRQRHSPPPMMELEEGETTPARGLPQESLDESTSNPGTSSVVLAGRVQGHPLQLLQSWRKYDMLQVALRV